MNLDRVDKEGLRACLYGMAVGDALGVPYEFSRRGTFECTGMDGYGTWCKPAGTYSDDTGMSIAMLDSIAERRKIDAHDMMDRFVDWHSGAYMADGDCFDTGNTVFRALIARHGMAGEMDNGNGSLMRIAPLAFLGCTDDEIREASAVTHAHDMSKGACLTFVRLVEMARKSLRDAKAEIIDMGIAGLRENEIPSGGFVMDTLRAALWCFSCTDNYRECVLKAVNLGRDTDTTACVAGAIAASAWGIDSIPSGWIGMLRGKDEIERVLAKF